MKNFFLVSLISLCVYSSSCTKEGPRGKALIKGYVKHHSTLIPGATVYIKYGTKDFPGSNTQYYNSSTVCNSNAYFEFKDMQKGNYYLFGIGFDSTFVKDVSGGLPIELKTKTQTLETVVAVTE